MTSNLGTALSDTIAAVLADGTDFADQDDATLLASISRLSTLSGMVETLTARACAVAATRSSRDLGHSGLAARSGFTSTEKLIQAVTRSTGPEAARLVQVGQMMTDSALEPVLLPVSTGELDDAGCPVPLLDDTGEPVVELVETNPTPWLNPVVAAVESGAVSPAAASAIRRGLSDPSSAVDIEALRDAVDILLQLACRVNADLLFTKARQLRDELDMEGVADREKALHDARYFRIRQNPDGSYRGSFQYGPEDGALLDSIISTLMSPRRGGPRFVDETSRTRAQALVADPRTNDQLQADAIIAALQLAVDADPGTFFGGRRPAVKVLVVAEALEPAATSGDSDRTDGEATSPAIPRTRRGFGRIEATQEAVALETVDRLICNSGTLGISFTGDGQALNLGRETRLFSRKQREVMAARDGGCIGSEDCNAPPSLCEAHHLDQWNRDHGRTDVDDGVLLCRFHHMNFHNNGYRIVRRGGRYWLVPPPEIDPAQTPVPLFSNNPTIARLHAS
ncbi:MAG: DUF222 domain-containing protein [Rhodoglobus sp.]